MTRRGGGEGKRGPQPEVADRSQVPGTATSGGSALGERTGCPDGGGSDTPTDDIQGWDRCGCLAEGILSPG